MKQFQVGQLVQIDAIYQHIETFVSISVADTERSSVMIGDYKIDARLLNIKTD